MAAIVENVSLVYILSSVGESAVGECVRKNCFFCRKVEGGGCRLLNFEGGGRQEGDGYREVGRRREVDVHMKRQFSLAPRGHFVRVGGGVGVVVDVHNDIVVGVIVDVHDGSISPGVLFVEFVDSVVKNTLKFFEPRGSGVSIIHVGDTTIKLCV